MTSPVNETAAADGKFARQAWIRALERTASIEQRGITLPVLIGHLGRQFGAAPALVSAEATLSYEGLALRSNQYARWGIGQGFEAGDRVALMMGNCAEYMAIWLGLTRAGIIVALINDNLVGEPLLHSLDVAAPKAIIAGSGAAPQVIAVRKRLPVDVSLWVYGHSNTELAALGAEVDRCSGAELPESERTAPLLAATALYIYTSGTTGLPKAAKVSHYRVMQWSHWFAGMMDTRPADRMFNCLPLYHSVGGVVATGATLVGGGAVVLRARFSASNFWRDVREQRCTLFQYIGELCRYLLNAPPQALDAEHSLRLACGNGLRPEIWEAFRQRCKIPRILEYYAATEGNFSLYNCEGRPGAIGRIPPFLAHRLPVALLKFDVERGEPWRNAAGFCERCPANEAGEAVGLISQAGGELAGRFEGYTDTEASARKVLRNVFTPGDAWYRTGDLMRRDAGGFYFFVDRVGDTYRWKGENVSTAEVLTALTACRGVIDGIVYGVAVPGKDGRAGAAALIVDAHFNLAELRADIAERLPVYARPVFLRLLPKLDSTDTFKPRKQELAQAGVDPSRISDPLFFDDPRVQAYVTLDAALFAAISSGTLRL